MEDRESAVKKYTELKEKYDLPELNELEEEFDFQLDDDSGIAKTIINHIWERISTIKSYVEGTLNPQRYCCMIETKFLNNKEKEKAFDFYKLLMTQYWMTIKETYGKPEQKIKQIKESYEFYKSIKDYTIKHIDKMISGWVEDDEPETGKDYIN